jgi:dolichol-phosphate mannosyltransferase
LIAPGHLGTAHLEAIARGRPVVLLSPERLRRPCLLLADPELPLPRLTPATFPYWWRQQDDGSMQRLAAIQAEWLRRQLLSTMSLGGWLMRQGVALDPGVAVGHFQLALALVQQGALREAQGGYAPARRSWCDDVTLARHQARQGPRVGFLAGSRVIQEAAYTSLGQMWREWGRSFDLADATPGWRRALDVALVWMVQALPLPLLLALAAWAPVPSAVASLHGALLAVNGVALAVRLGMLAALRGSYAQRGAPYWLSWLFDGAAAWRLTLSTLRRPTAWRGRGFTPLPAS